MGRKYEANTCKCVDRGKALFFLDFCKNIKCNDGLDLHVHAYAYALVGEA